MNGTTILLNYNDDTKKVEEEEQTRFLQHLLERMGVPTSDIWDSSDEPLTPAQKTKLSALLETFKVEVIDDFDGGMKVYSEQTLVGEWYKCTYKLKRDLSQINPKKQLYLEMEVKYWSLFEESDD
jgi:hypothetical protein